MDSSEFKMREYIAADAGEMRRLHDAFADFMREILSPEMWPFDAPAADGFDAWLNSTQVPDKRLLVAEAGDGKLAGYILGTIEDEPGQLMGKWGYVDDLFIDQEYRRHGLGKNLMEGMETWFRTQGCGAVAVDSWLANPDASRAYEAMGFTANYTGYVRRI